MRFRMLGPLRINNGRWVPIPAEQQRVVLAVLLIEAGKAVETGRLIEEVWGQHPPRGALKTVQGYVFRLRRILGGGAGCPLRTMGHGYEMSVAVDDVDVQLFEQLVSSARRDISMGRLEFGVGKLTEALGLWRGRPLSDVPMGPTVEAEVSRLELARLDAVEERLAAMLVLGRHFEVAAEAQALVHEHPLRERLQEQLITALAQSGRRSEALAAYQQARQVMVAELGLEPGAALQRLQQQILAGEVEAEKPRPPALLPREVAAFSGREPNLAQLDGLFPATVVLSGIAGVGKTALAVHWAHAARGRFPDGQLFADLNGYSADPPVPPLEVLAGFLRALGVPPETIPVDLAGAVSMYRTLSAERKMLVLLDNARDAEQVRPLLPAGKDCCALITSRDQLLGLVARDGALGMTLDALTPAESMSLLGRILGRDRVKASQADAAELSILCGHLPLALRIAAAHLSAWSKMSIADYVRNLRSDRMGALLVPDDPQVGVRTAFHLSYKALPAVARRLFRMLGQAPGPDLAAAAVAALAGQDPDDVAILLDRLARAHLVSEHVPRRYSMHDLLRHFAAESSQLEDSESDRAAALTRLFDYYLANVCHAADLLYPDMLRLPRGEAAGSFDHDTQASTWLDSERVNLVAALRLATDTASFPLAWRLADGLRGYLYLGMHTVDWLTVAEAGLTAAQADKHLPAQASAHISLAMLHATQGRFRQSIHHLDLALPAAREAGWVEGQSTILAYLGVVHANMGKLDEAAGYYEQALEIDRAAGWSAGQAARLTNLGLTNIDRGRLRLAAGQLAQAAELNRQIGSPSSQARTLASLGDAYHAMSDFEAAHATLTEALALHREIGDRSAEADTMWILAAVHRDAGRYEEALQLAREALDLADRIGKERARANALVVIASTHHQLGDYEQAIEGHREALAIASDIGEQLIEASALVGLADSHHRRGEHEQAAKHAKLALATAKAGGYRLVEGQALATQASIELDQFQIDAAIRDAESAASLHAETGHRLGEAHAHLIAARALTRAGRHAAARAHQRQGNELLEAISGQTRASARVKGPPRTR